MKLPTVNRMGETARNNKHRNTANRNELAVRKCKKLRFNLGTKMATCCLWKIIGLCTTSKMEPKCRFWRDTESTKKEQMSSPNALRLSLRGSQLTLISMGVSSLCPSEEWDSDHRMTRWRASVSRWVNLPHNSWLPASVLLSEVQKGEGDCAWAHRMIWNAWIPLAPALRTLGSLCWKRRGKGVVYLLAAQDEGRRKVAKSHLPSTSSHAEKWAPSPSENQLHKCNESLKEECESQNWQPDAVGRHPKEVSSLGPFEVGLKKALALVLQGTCASVGREVSCLPQQVFYSSASNF